MEYDFPRGCFLLLKKLLQNWDGSKLLTKRSLLVWDGSKRRDKVFIVALAINLCIVTVLGVQLGLNISQNLNQQLYVSTITQDGAIRGGKPATSMAAIACNVDWGEAEIPKMIDIFRENDVKISFFPCGRWAEKNPEVLRQMYGAGHEIGNHGYGHKLCTQIGMEQSKQEILKTETAINSILGIKTNLFAPPSGDYKKDTVAMAEDLGYKTILWTADTVDWKEGSTADVIKKRVLKKDLNGAIILMHPKPETVKALPELIAEIEKQGIKLVTVSELLAASEVR